MAAGRGDLWAGSLNQGRLSAVGFCFRSVVDLPGPSAATLRHRQSAALLFGYSGCPWSVDRQELAHPGKLPAAGLGVWFRPRGIHANRISVVDTHLDD